MDNSTGKIVFDDKRQVIHIEYVDKNGITRGYVINYEKLCNILEYCSKPITILTHC